MALRATGKPTITTTYTLQDTATSTVSNSTVAGLQAYSESVVAGVSFDYTDGTGTGNLNMGWYETGSLPASGTKVFDFITLPKTYLGLTSSLNFGSGIKSIIISNTFNGMTGTGGPSQGTLLYGADGTPTNAPLFTVAATGTDRFTGLFNGESGNINVHFMSSWSYSDYVGMRPSASNSTLTLIDSGSGCSYEVSVLGVTGTP